MLLQVTGLSTKGQGAKGSLAGDRVVHRIAELSEESGSLALAVAKMLNPFAAV